jgi:hypothetical protein
MTLGPWSEPAQVDVYAEPAFEVGPWSAPAQVDVYPLPSVWFAKTGAGWVPLHWHSLDA